MKRFVAMVLLVSAGASMGVAASAEVADTVYWVRNAVALIFIVIGGYMLDTLPGRSAGGVE